MRKLLLVAMLVLWPAVSWAALGLDYDFGTATTASFGTFPRTFTVTSKSGGCASGDLVIVQYYIQVGSGCQTAAAPVTITNGGGTWSSPTPTGCANPAYNADHQKDTIGLQQETAGGSEPNSYTLSVAAPAGCSGSTALNIDYRVTCLSGANQTLDKIVCSTGNGGGSVTSFTAQPSALSMTTTAADYALAQYFLFINANWSPGTTPSGYTNTVNSYDSGDGVNYQSDYLLQGAAGATAPTSAYSNATGAFIFAFEYLLGVAPASAGPTQFGFFGPGLP